MPSDPTAQDAHAAPAPEPPELDRFRADLARQGFTIVPGILTQDEALEMRAALAQAIVSDAHSHHAGGRDQGMVHALILHGRPFEKLLANQRLRAFLSAVLTDRCILYSYTSSSMPPHGENYSCRVHVDCPRFIPGHVTNVGVTLMLDDFTEANGASWLMPGSHLLAEAPGDEAFYAAAVRATGRPGDAIVFNARCWHAGAPNESDAWRHAATLNVCRPYMRQQFDWARLVPREIVERNPASVRQFLGYDVRVPASLAEFYVPAEDRLYKPGQED